MIPFLQVEKDEQQQAKIEQDEVPEPPPGEWAEPTTAAAGAIADEKWRDTTGQCGCNLAVLHHN